MTRRYRTIDDESLGQLDSITNWESHRALSWLSCDGLKGVTHAYFMHCAREVVKGKISLDEFIHRYKVDNFSKPGNEALKSSGNCGTQSYGFLVSVKALEEEGIYAGREANDHILSEGKLMRGGHKKGDDVERFRRFFDWDQGNNFLCKVEGINTQSDVDLYKREWKSEDFQNPEIVERGVQYGRDLFTLAVHQFNNPERHDKKSTMPIESIQLGERIIEGYSKFLEEIR